MMRRNGGNVGFKEERDIVEGGRRERGNFCWECRRKMLSDEETKVVFLVMACEYEMIMFVPKKKMR